MLLFGILAALLLTATSPIVFASGSRFSNAKRYNAESVCKVKAWVRAEDLYPNAMAKGDLRLKITSCTEEVTSIALQLQLDEFSEVKYLKEGASLPNHGNMSLPHMFGIPGDSEQDDSYRGALRNPALWSLLAEERTAFKTSVILFEGPVDYSRPVVTPFLVAVPNVNFPPGQRSHGLWHTGEEEIAGSKHSYHYTAVITFANGKTISVPAGYTTFFPTHEALPPAKKIVTNVTFEELPKCRTWGQLDECASNAESTTFGAQVTLEGGNVVRAGDTMRGRIIVHPIKNGSTTAEHLYVSISSQREDLWAQTQAALGGNTNSFSPGSCFATDFQGQEITTSSWGYGDLLSNDDRYKPLPHIGDCELRERSHYLEFEEYISEDIMRNFRAYYVTFETFLFINLEVAYPPKVRTSMFGDEVNCNMEEPIGDGDLYGEGLWDEYTSVDQPKEAQAYQPTHVLSAKIPITLVGAQHSDAGSPASPPPAHYLTPGTPSPLILAGSPPADIVFLVSQPVITPEPIENTTSRLLSNGFMENMPGSCDPTRDYFAGPYAGLLWKKKIMSENLLPIRPTESAFQGLDGFSDSQIVL